MKHSISALAALVATALLLALVGSMLVRSRLDAGAGRVYPLWQFAAGLTDHGRAWTGQTFRVRAQINPVQLVEFNPKGRAPVPGVTLTDAMSDWQGEVTQLPVEAGAEDPLLARLRALPGIGTLIPPPQTAFVSPSVYRIRVEAQPGLCVVPTTCVVPVLLDAGAMPWIDQRNP